MTRSIMYWRSINSYMQEVKSIALLQRVLVDVLDYSTAVKMLMNWSQRNESRYACFANVHMLMEAHDSEYFQGVVNEADLVTPDGMPLVWMMRLKGIHRQERIYGPTLMLRILEAAAWEQIPVGFYGGKPSVLESLMERMQICYEGLNQRMACDL